MSLHAKIVAHLRTQVEKDGSPFKEYFTDFTDAQVMRVIFFSFRGKETPQGMRLSPTGIRIMESYFKPYEITMPDGYHIGSADMLYLDAKAQWPYYIGFGVDDGGKERLVVFDHKLGIKLKLADGAISNLREIESF